jgi:hypothetical protein
MAKESSHVSMEEDMKENTREIKSLVMEYLIGVIKKIYLVKVADGRKYVGMWENGK